ncbi:MAG: sulfatase-like hydrolase/transferase, partial [Chitinophagales bacterium]|nr:sulfatase-like hydrolase/transferase [Chitinophagales bacterium]
EKELSWNKISIFNDFYWVESIQNAAEEGVEGFQWSRLDDTIEHNLKDFRTVDTVLAFIRSVQEDPSVTCNKPFFMAVGIAKPHLDIDVPVQYYPSYYNDDFYEEPFDYPYYTTFDTAGIIMPPQPATMWEDYYSFPANGVARALADGKVIVEEGIDAAIDAMPFLPEIDPLLTDAERIEIIKESIRANAVMANIAGVQYVDAQIGRLIDSLRNYPEIFNNTIIVFTSDHGLSLGEKRHWRKACLWETDIRTPFMMYSPLLEHNKVIAENVSLLDVFPTLCELTGTAYPLFPDNSAYLDGTSFYPLIQNANLRIEKPLLSSIRNQKSSQGKCYPHFSVRSKKFHYIQYTPNNNMGTILPCDSSGTIPEKELYFNNEDPHEWNNLAQNPDYTIVEKYLKQWFHGGKKYLDPAYTVVINLPADACTYKSTDSLLLSAELFDTEGQQQFMIPADKHLVWWTNAGSDSSFAMNQNLNLSSLPDIASGAATELLIYLALYSNDFSSIDGLDIIKIHIDNTSANYPKFKVHTKKKKAKITHVIYPPGTAKARWDYGDGFVYEGLTPPLHIYASYGNYTITCSAYKDELQDCSAIKALPITLDASAHIYFRVSPNPVTESMVVEFMADEGYYEVLVYNIKGEVVLRNEMVSET